jgi:hypothetical protein
VVAFSLKNKSALRRRSLPVGLLLSIVSAIFVYAYLPIRSAIVTAQRLDPTLQLGFPPGHPYWDYAHPSTLRGFLWLVTGAQVQAYSSFLSMLSVRTFSIGIVHFALITLAEFSAVGIVALIVGLFVGWRRHSDITLFVVLSCLLIAAFTAAFGAETDPDRYYMVSFGLVAILVGMGFEAMAARVSRARGPFGGAAVTLIMIGLVAIGMYRERAIFGWRYDHWGSDYVNRVRSLTSDDAIVVAPWVLATPLAYAAYVEKSFGHRIVETGDLKDDSPYLHAWTMSRPVYVVLDRYAPAGFCLVKTDGGDPPIFRLEHRCIK